MQSKAPYIYTSIWKCGFLYCIHH